MAIDGQWLIDGQVIQHAAELRSYLKTKLVRALWSGMSGFFCIVAVQAVEGAAAWRQAGLKEDARREALPSRAESTLDVLNEIVGQLIDVGDPGSYVDHELRTLVHKCWENPNPATFPYHF